MTTLYRYTLIEPTMPPGFRYTC
uniref:Uncharacterized protein n=1 Tax=Arundo donax TaxID=35708 RepID=A0A0A9A6L3_ARUDO